MNRKSTMADQSTQQNRIAALLEAYGADVQKWPEAERHLGVALSAEPRAKRLQQADALDHVLRQARTKAEADAQAAPAPLALMARIERKRTAAASASRPIANASIANHHRPLPSANPISRAAQRPRYTRNWTATAAVLAASLVLGLFLGSTTQFEPTARSLGHLAGLSDSTQLSALEDDAFSILDDEDIL